jgi:hypothetical protein
MKNQEIKDFIAKRENLQLAMEVSDYINELKQETHRVFWEAMNIELMRLLEQEKLDNWVFTRFNMNKLRSDWKDAYISFVQPDKNKPVPLLGFGIGQTSPESNFRLYGGVTKNKVLLGSFVKLRGLLSSVDITKSSDWWVGWDYFPIIPYTTEFIYQVHNNKEEYIKECAQFFWRIFLLLREEVENINLQLIKEYQSIENKELIDPL